MIFFIFIINVVSDRILILALKRHSLIPHFCVSGWIPNLAFKMPHFSGDALLGLSPVVFTLQNVLKTFKENSQETSVHHKKIFGRRDLERVSCAHNKCPQYILSKRQEVKFLSVTWNLLYHMLEKILSHEMHLPYKRAT